MVAATDKTSSARIQGPRRLSITGRVVMAKSGAGIPNLLVECRDTRATAARLGSTVTGNDGGFVVLAELDPDSRPDIQVEVFAPERQGQSRAQRLVYTSDVRVGVSGDENFPIEVSAAQLTGAGVTRRINEGARAAATLKRSTRERARVHQQAEATLSALVDDRVARRVQIRRQVRKVALGQLSSVSPVERTSGRYLAPRADILAMQLSALHHDLVGLAATSTIGGRQRAQVQRPSRIQLDPTAVAALIGGRRTPVAVSQDTLEATLGHPITLPASVARSISTDDACRARTAAEECLSPSPGPAPAAAGGGAGGAAPVPFTTAGAVDEIMGRLAAPEEPLVFGPTATSLETPLTSGGVDDVVRGLVFAPGPADVPAFHDFHDVQIAFEPVWQEALDDKYLEDVEAAYDLIVEDGGAPALTAITTRLNSGSPFGLPAFDHLLDVLADVSTAIYREIPSSVTAATMITEAEWLALPVESRGDLAALASQILTARDNLVAALDPEHLQLSSVTLISDLLQAISTRETLGYHAQLDILRAEADRIVANGRRRLLEREATGPWKPTHTLVESLRTRRGTRYPYRFFAASSRARSVNFGLIVTYRQTWTPISYQVGELVRTIPLAPREGRKFSTRTMVRTRRATQEVETNLVSRRRESEEHSRAEAEIVARASTKTNFNLSSEGTFSFQEAGFGGSAKTTSVFSRDAEQHSEAIKKEFREAVLKSAEEFRNERKMEVSTEETAETERTESGEIQNPNDEIPVTFLFYELQRRYRVAEKLHRLRAVVYVAQEVPRPKEIDATWIIEHDWILNRSLLDDSFAPAIAYASTTMVSEEVVLRELRDALYRQRRLVEELKEDVADRRATAGLRYAALERQIERNAQASEGGGGLFGSLGDALGGLDLGGRIVGGALDFLTGGGDGDAEAAQTREGAARDAFDRERREEQERAARLENAVSSLAAMEREYADRLGRHLREVTQVERLASHIVANITHYMQAVWAHEPDDQRFLRLRDVPVPVFTRNRQLPRFVIDPRPIAAPPDLPRLRSRTYGVSVGPSIVPPPAQPQQIQTRPLAEVADLSQPLGFLGNYMILPLYESNPITDTMMDPYVTLAEGEYGITDPDPLGNMTLDEFADYVCCLRKRLFGHVAPNAPAGTQPAEWRAIEPVLRAALRRLLQLALRNNDEVVIPTDSLFIEALPGAHSVMERFKNLHRQIDVRAAQENLRRSQLDNVRRAERLITGALEDPDIEAVYRFDGDPRAIVTPPAPGPGAGGGGG